jgi:hypothetical protein
LPILIHYSQYALAAALDTRSRIIMIGLDISSPPVYPPLNRAVDLPQRGKVKGKIIPNEPW